MPLQWRRMWEEWRAGYWRIRREGRQWQLTNLITQRRWTLWTFLEAKERAQMEEDRSAMDN